MRASNRVRLGKMTHPVRGFLHGSAGVVSLIATALLVGLATTDVSGRIALLLFGLSLVALYTTSSLYHSVPWTRDWKRRMQKLDHLMIHVLTAGTYTPIAVIVFDGWLEVVTLVVYGDPRGSPIGTYPTSDGWLAMVCVGDKPWEGIDYFARTHLDRMEQCLTDIRESVAAMAAGDGPCA